LLLPNQRVATDTAISRAERLDATLDTAVDGTVLIDASAGAVDPARFATISMTIPAVISGLINQHLPRADGRFRRATPNG
jgi:hypothetical protein